MASSTPGRGLGPGGAMVKGAVKGTRAMVQSGAVLVGGDYDARAYAEVTRERVDNLADQVQRLEGKINALVYLLVGQMVSFILAVIVVLINHVKF